VSRLWSGSRMNLRIEVGPNGTTTEAVASCVLSILDDADDGAIQRSSYHRTIQRLESVVSPERIAYFFYETLFEQSEIDRLCAFLDIDSVSAAVDDRIGVGSDASNGIPEDVARKAREALMPTYEFCKAKFGTLPAEWQHDAVRRET